MMNDDIVSLRSLEKRADFFAAASLSAATKKAYETDWRRFLAWCMSHELETIPATPETVCLYLSDMADGGAAVSTIIRRLTSITAIHSAAGEFSPVKDDRVCRVLKGIKRQLGTAPEQARAISWKELKRLVSHCDSLMMGLRDAAILVLGWASAARRSELVALNVGDLEISDQGLLMTIRRSKTDQEGHGHKIGIPRAKNDLCPVATVERWLLRRTTTPLNADEPVFVKIGMHGRGKWWWAPGDRLAARMVSEVVKRYANFAGLDSAQYSAHSLRRGFATEAGARGIPERVISRHTRHRSIQVLRGYIDEGSIWHENPLPAIYTSSAPIPSGEQ
jgi:site-specific recombinase XerD